MLARARAEAVRGVASWTESDEKKIVEKVNARVVRVQRERRGLEDVLRSSRVRGIKLRID